MVVSQSFVLDEEHKLFGFDAGYTRDFLEHLFKKGLDRGRFMRDCKRYSGKIPLTEFLKLVSMGIYEEMGLNVPVDRYTRVLAVIQRFRSDRL